MLAALITLFVVGIVGLVVLSLVLALIGAIFGIAFGIIGFLIFKVVPILLIGFVIVWFLKPRRSATTASQ
jgi:hypothetical protein